MTVHEQHLPESAPRTSGQEVPDSLDALLALHGSDPALDSRRHLRRSWWSRSANLTHVIGAGMLTVAALFVTSHQVIDALLVLVIAGVGAVTILRSYAARPGHHVGGELLIAAIAAAVWWVPPLVMAPYDLDPSLTPQIWHVASAGAAIFCACIVVADLARSTLENARAVRICATLMGVFAAAALAL